MPITRFHLAFLLLIPATALAAEPLSAPVTFDSVVAAASQTHPDLIAARERLQIAIFNRKAAAAAFLPQVSVGASYDRSGGETAAGETLRTDDAYGLSATARQNLYAGGRDAAIYRRREAEAAATAADLDAVRATVSFDLKAAFARLLFAQDQTTLSRSINQRRAENVRLVGLRYEAGREHKGSYLRSRANAHQAEFEVAQAERALRVAQRELLRASGRSGFEAIVATGTLTVSAPGPLPDFESLVTQVPTVRAAAANVRVAEADVTSARGLYLPDFDASATAGRSGGAWPPEDERWSAGVSLSLPIFQGGASYYSVKAARASLARSSEERRSTVDQAALDLEDAYASFADAAGRAEVQSDFLSAAVVRAEIARSQYTSGLLSFDDWDLIESDLITAQKNHLTSLRDAVVAEATWERLRGQGAVK